MPKRKPKDDDDIGGFEILGGMEPTPEPEAAPKLSGLTAAEKRLEAKLIAGLAAIQKETLSLYEPLPHQEVVHRCNAQERLVYGSNQCGKTTCAIVELIWIITGQHPYLKYPKSGDAFVVGRDSDHLGHTILKKMLQPQSTFKRIRDQKTGKWRQFRPNDDADRAEEAEPCGPLLPMRMVKNIAWEDRGKGIPKVITMKNGWTVTFFTANGQPPAGATVDYIWFDEEVGDAWAREAAPRLMAKKGKILWSATPQVGGVELYEMHKRCQEHELRPVEERSSVEFKMDLMSNVHIEDDEKEKLKEKYRNDPDSYRVRIEGDFLIEGGKIYPEWSKSRHSLIPFSIPDTWCRYVVVDPGHTVCAVMMFAVAPPNDPQWGRHVIGEGELYIRQCDPSKFADEMKHFCDGKQIQAFIIDDCGSRRTDGAIGMNMREAYSIALEKRGIRSTATGSNFMTGSSDVKTGIAQFHTWLNEEIPHPGYDIHPKFMVFQTCSNFIYEIERYQKKRDKQFGWLDEPNNKNAHLMDTARYAALHGCGYKKPVPPVKNLYRKYLEEQKKLRRAIGSAINLCAGSGNG